MQERWAMVRCECGRYFGSSLKKIVNCPRCNSSKNHKIMKKFSSSESLRDQISKANTPSEIVNEITSRLETYEKPNRDTGLIGKELIGKILATSTFNENIISIDSISNSIKELSLTKISPEDIIEILEASSLVVRNSNGTWTVFQ
tara:strand:- start:44 stop:478 length:435 start_codon:yes stop_codon:yes gene_type:complete